MELRAALDPQSTIDLTGFDHYIAMPNLAAFANTGFPFTKYADLAQTAIVLPISPTVADGCANLLGRRGPHGRFYGLCGTRFALLSSDSIDPGQKQEKFPEI